MLYHMPFILHEIQGCIIFTGGVKITFKICWLAGIQQPSIFTDIFVEEQQNRHEFHKRREKCRCCGDSQLFWQEPGKIVN